MNPESPISAFMRENQRKSVQSRLARTTPEQRKEQMRAMAKARWAKQSPDGKPKQNPTNETTKASRSRHVHQS